MKKMMMVAACVGGLACMLACNKEEVGAYQDSLRRDVQI